MSKAAKDRHLGSLSDDQKFERLMELVEELHVNNVENNMIQEEMVKQMGQRVAAKLEFVKADVLRKLEEAKQLALLED
jgi:outer membrane lipopolysaccharide assembly protein LptE/RlpB